MLNNYKLDTNNIEKIYSKSSHKYLIYIKKKRFMLFVINRERRIEKQFNIALGKKANFFRKIHDGDDGTPEGIYFIKEILSLNADKDSEDYKKLRRMNYVYFKAEEGHYLWGHPDKDAGKNVYGPRFFRLSFPNEGDKKLYKEMKQKHKIPKNKKGEFVGQGTGIGIHGTNDPASIRHRISSGCIRMHNHDIVKLDQFIQIGTPVYIER